MNPSEKKILLVEDEDFIRDLYVRELTKAGYQVKSSPDGTSGLNTLMSENFDLLLLDIMLPGLNGLQVLREFRTKNPGSKTIVILLTNLGQEAVIKEGFELGAQAYLIKGSYTPDQVVNEVTNALTGQAASGSTPVAGPLVNPTVMNLSSNTLPENPATPATQNTPQTPSQQPDSQNPPASPTTNSDPTDQNNH